jgi:hypothetical protein
MSAIQTFGVTALDVQNRVQGLSNAVSTQGPNPDGFDAMIMRASAALCGELIGAQLEVLEQQSDNPVMWEVCRSAIIARAAWSILTSRNRGAATDASRTLDEEYKGYITTIRRYPQRAGSNAPNPGPHSFTNSLKQSPGAFANTAGNGYAYGRRGL